MKKLFAILLTGAMVQGDSAFAFANGEAGFDEYEPGVEDEQDMRSDK